MQQRTTNSARTWISMETTSVPARSTAACRAVLPDCCGVLVAAVKLAPARSSGRTVALELLAAACMRAVRPSLSLALTSDVGAGGREAWVWISCAGARAEQLLQYGLAAQLLYSAVMQHHTQNHKWSKACNHPLHDSHSAPHPPAPPACSASIAFFEPNWAASKSGVAPFAMRASTDT